MDAILCFIIFISNSHFGEKPRYLSRDAEIQAKDGNKPTDIAYHYQLVCHPWSLDFGIPAEMTGLYLSFLIQNENCWDFATARVRLKVMRECMPALRSILLN